MGTPTGTIPRRSTLWKSMAAPTPHNRQHGSQRPNMRKPPRVSTYHLTNRNTWCIRWREPGTLKQRQYGQFATQEQAEEAAVHKRRELRNPLSQAQETLSIGQLLAEYYDQHIAAGILKTGTREIYERHMALLLDSQLVSIEANQLTTAMVNRWIREQDRAPSTMRNMLVVLSAAYRYAIEHGVSGIDHNPVHGARRPPQQRTRLVIPTTSEILQLSMSVPYPDAKWRSALLIAALCGLRWQELFALEWEHISPHEIHVRQALTGTSSSIETVKTENGYRDVPLMPSVYAVLMEWREQLQPTRDEPLLFPNAHGQPMRSGNFQNYVYRPWKTQADVDVLWRHLRHFYVSYLASRQENPFNISKWAGHSSYSFTLNTYGSLFTYDREATAARLEQGINDW